MVSTKSGVVYFTMKGGWSKYLRYLPAAASLAGSAYRAYRAIRGNGYRSRPALRRRRFVRRVRGPTRRKVFRRRTFKRGKRRSVIPLGHSFNMNPNNWQMLKMKNITEVSLSWTLITGGAVSTTPKRIQTTHTNWMPRPATHELQEAIWNTYYHKLLTKFRYAIKDMRMFIETVSTYDAIGTAAATTQVTIDEPKEWVLWYWRQLNEGATDPPQANDESRYTRKVLRSMDSVITGFVPLNNKRAKMITDPYAIAFEKSTGLYDNMDQYLLLSDNYTPVNRSNNSTSVPCGDIWCMPDDPYPNSYYAPDTTTKLKERRVNITIEFDIHTFATWKLLKPITL